MTSEAQKRANKKWNDAHRDRIKYLNKRSTAKKFILNSATEDDLAKLTDYISERQKALQSKIVK